MKKSIGHRERIELSDIGRFYGILEGLQEWPEGGNGRKVGEGKRGEGAESLTQVDKA